MKPDFGNTVIVIGGDHQNTLAVVRCLGKNRCSQKILIHTNCSTTQQLSIAHSKFANGRTYCVSESADEIVRWLLSNISYEKQILFPCSDLAAYAIDANSSLLSEHYVLPGFRDTPGKVTELMDKWKQKEFAREHDLPMAQTWQLSGKDGFSIPGDMVYPCIVKPEISAFGRKGDITVCYTAEALSEALRNLASLGYEQLVVQQFLVKDYEVCAYGCLVDDKNLCAGGTIRKIREYPPRGGGSLTFARFIDEKCVNALRDKVLGILYDEGYRGQYDIEFFVCKDGVYLNEINFRHSGNGYGLVLNDVPAPYIGCADAIGAKISSSVKTAVKAGKYHMDELSDLRHVKARRISPLAWVRDCFRTSAFSKLAVWDMRGTFAYYLPFIRSAMGKIIPQQRKQ